MTDSAGTQSSSLTGTGTDITPPTTQITAPPNNATVSGTVTVTATASDNVGVASIKIFIDGAQAASGTSSPLNYSWNTTALSNGSHTIYSKAYDAAGNIGNLDDGDGDGEQLGAAVAPEHRALRPAT